MIKERNCNEPRIAHILLPFSDKTSDLHREGSILPSSIAIPKDQGSFISAIIDILVQKLSNEIALTTVVLVAGYERAGVGGNGHGGSLLVCAAILRIQP